MHPAEINAEGFVSIDGIQMYCIPDYDKMPSFFMSLTSDTDLWLYTSSSGGVTAGRVDEEHGLFFYETVDKLHLAGGITGPKSYLRIIVDGKVVIWEPFTAHNFGQLTRNIYKNINGNCIVFEEINHYYNLTFRYSWSNSDEFGFTRKSTLINNRNSRIDVSIIDGLLNIIPANTVLYLQKNISCIIDAYTRCEVDKGSGLCIISMSALIMDSPKPFESLMANTAWQTGLPEAKILLTVDQLHDFFAGKTLHQENDLKGRRCGFLVNADISLNNGESRQWYINADVNKSQISVEKLREELLNNSSLESAVETAIEHSNNNLTSLISSSDGNQLTGDEIASAHHGVNVLFNIMRGGIFDRDYVISVADFRLFIEKKNKKAVHKYLYFFDKLPADISHAELLNAAKKTDIPEILRLCNEYLPLTFGRRHGDPSRPWNRFTVKVKNDDGSRVLNYQGNWRDIFQNWEALGLSYPEFLEGMISRFVNISTVDGFNPYRIYREGFEWETVEQDDPWSNIGYWGDHQIIYLLKLLESANNFYPGKLNDMLKSPSFTYANVPYRLHKYADLVNDPKTTIDYDHKEAKLIAEKISEIGEDGKLVFVNDDIYHVNLTEKLLVTALSKISNLVVDGGIWMNTQRPEWNDGNNALVGYGLSMVTLYYLRRYISFCHDIFISEPGEVIISAEVLCWLNGINAVLHEHILLLDSDLISGEKRKAVMDDLGKVFEDYRENIYKNGFSKTGTISFGDINDFFTMVLSYLDHAIKANRREDGMYHAYNLIKIDGNCAIIKELHEMLEGQVAVISSGVLSSDEVIAVLDSLFASKLYRPDQSSFMLAPVWVLPGFLDKNIVDTEDVNAMPYLVNNNIISKDVAGNYRFASSLRNNNDLQIMLNVIEDIDLNIKNTRDDITNLYEKVFNHHSFIGRSGIMYGYEGIGCIYWHMVAKLLLAVQEAYLRAVDKGEDATIKQKLSEYYYKIRDGLGYNKNARQYGAFPIDPYSHTPEHSGAQQPGMTGQVKEEIITRWGELGITIKNGTITFNPTLLSGKEFTKNNSIWDYYDLQRQLKTLSIFAESLVFTICMVPVIYYKGNQPTEINILYNDSKSTKIKGNCIPASISAEIFARTGKVMMIQVRLSENLF